MKLKKKNIFYLKKLYNLEEALNILRENSKLKINFDESVDVEFVLNIDYKRSEQRVRSFAFLPNGTGKVCKIAVFYKGSDEVELRKIKNVFVGYDDLLASVKKTRGKKFDLFVTTPNYLKDLSEVKNILGKRSLLPTERDGTLVTCVLQDVQRIQKQQVNYKTDSSCSIKSSFGRISYTNKELYDNLKFLLNDVTQKHTISIRNSLIKKIKISTTMGSCFNVDVNSIKFF